MEFLGYELKYNLGVTRDIKRVFGMDFNKVVTKELSVDELIKFIHTCIANVDMTRKDFEEMVYDSELGIMDIQNTYMDLSVKIMYPGLSLEEGKQKLREIADQT